MKKLLSTLILSGFLLSMAPAMAEGTHGTNGQVSLKSVGAGALSLIIWPGLGQIVNGQSDEKVITHALLGLTILFRFWSCYDGIVDRDGGVWKNRI